MNSSQVPTNYVFRIPQVKNGCISEGISNTVHSSKYGIAINLLCCARISNPERLIILPLCSLLYHTRMLIQRLQKWWIVKTIQNSAYGTVLDCFYLPEISVDFSIHHFSSHWITTFFKEINKTFIMRTTKLEDNPT